MSRSPPSLPHATFVIFEDSGHMAPLEAPAAVTQALQAWMAELVREPGCRRPRLCRRAMPDERQRYHQQRRRGARSSGLKQELVCGSKILVRHNIVDAFGHVSVRHPHDPAQFLMSKRIPPSLVTAGDIRVFGLDGELVDRDGSPVFLERFIHSEIFAARPEVQAIVHSHSSTIVAFGVVTDNPLRAVCHTCGFLGTAAPVFEMRDTAGDGTNLLISTPTHGRNLVAAMGDANVILMRGHGSTVVGWSIAHAVYRAVYTEVNAKIQTVASGLGTVKFLSAAEAEASQATDVQLVERAWQAWMNE